MAQMGISDKDSAREDVAAWLKQHETKFFFDKLEEEIVETLKSMANFNSSGETLSKDYYRAQGTVLGLERTKDLAEQLAKGEE